MDGNTSEFLGWLPTTILFQGLSTSQLVSLIRIAQYQTWQKDEVLFKQGYEATGFFIVKKGRIKIFNSSPAGKEQILNIFESGENFAEVVALDGKPFPVSAAALELSELLYFPRQECLNLLRQYPDIAINMLISLSKHSRHLVGVIEDLSFKDVPQRLAEYLLNLADQTSDVITLDLTKGQLAAMLGTIPATLSRAFYRLSQEGMIAVQGSQIELLDRDRLHSLSQMLEQEDNGTS